MNIYFTYIIFYSLHFVYIILYFIVLSYNNIYFFLLKKTYFIRLNYVIFYYIIYIYIYIQIIENIICLVGPELRLMFPWDQVSAAYPRARELAEHKRLLKSAQGKAV